MSAFTDDLERRLHSLPGPFLFVGSGLSRRYAKLPDWEGLLRHFADETAHPYEYYRGAAKNDMPQTASLIATDFYDIWWTSPKYASSRAAHAASVTSADSVLKIAVADYINDLESSATLSPLEEEELAALRKAVIEGAITTNYDQVIPSTFADFTRFVGQDELLLSDTFNIAEIYQIHGSAQDPETLVLTADDYADFNRRNAYLAAKLMTIFVEHPVVFLGYSLSDANIRQILTSLVSGLRGRSTDALKDKLIVVEWDAASTASATDSTIQIGTVSIPIVRVVVPDFRELFNVLSNRVRALPARLLRIMKSQLFELVKSGDPGGRLFAATDIDSSTSSVDVVFGVGAKMTAVGVVGLNRFDLIDDVLANPERNLPADTVVQHLIAKFAKTVYVPCFKYLHGANFVETGGTIAASAPGRVATRASIVRTRLEAQVGMRGALLTIAQLEADHGWEWIFNQGDRILRVTDDRAGLRDFLVMHLDKRSRSWFSTQYAKLAVVYDWMRFDLDA